MLIAVSGLSGAGKTTALDHLRGTGGGRIVYVGGFVHDERVRRGLAATRENEKFVRDDMRQTLGNGILAEMAVAQIGGGPHEETFLLDAICGKEEADCYRRNLGRHLIVLSIEARFEMRATRLAARTDHPYTAEQLTSRDDYELSVLMMGEVMAAANHRITNEGDLDSFRRELDRLRPLWRGVGA